MTTCRHCGYESPDLATCPLCGTPSGRGDAMGRDPGAGGESPTGDAALPPWEDPDAGFPLSLMRTWRRSLLEPSAFFAGVPYEKAAARPILYYLIIGVLSAFFWLWWTAVFSTVEIPLLTAIRTAYEPLAGVEPSGRGSPAASALLNFFFAPFGAILTLIVWSFLLHLFVLMLARKRRNLTATVRTVCYAAGPALFAVVPLVGSLVGGVWTIVLSVIGLREAHRMSTGAAVAAVLLALLVPTLILGAFFVLLLAAAASLAV